MKFKGLYLLPLVAPIKSLITVHLIHHSHDDVGWHETPEYYYNDMVDGIITQVVDELLINAERRFSQVEMKFMSMWWAKQTDDRKQQVR
jgi:lysosomal alpha-mannosidase